MLNKITVALHSLHASRISLYPPHIYFWMHPEVKKEKGWEELGALACVGDLHLSTVVWSQTPTWASQGDGREDVPSPFITPNEDRRGGDTFP